MLPDASLNALTLDLSSISSWYPLTPSLRIDRALPAHLVRRSRLLRLGRFHFVTGIDHTLHQERPADYQTHQH